MQTTLSIIVLTILIAAYGYLVQRRFYQRHYTTSNLIFASLALAFAGLSGASKTELGIRLSWYSLLAVAITIFITISIVSVVIRYAKLRMQKADYKELAVRIPFGTALSEELIFRSALLGLFLQVCSNFYALLLSSLIFGLWHLLPGESSVWAQQNLKYKNTSPRLAKICSSAITVLVTAFGGFIFGWLRIVSGGILLPWAAHTAINAASWTIHKASKQGSFAKFLGAGRKITKS